MKCPKNNKEEFKQIESAIGTIPYTVWREHDGNIPEYIILNGEGHKNPSDSINEVFYSKSENYGITLEDDDYSTDFDLDEDNSIEIISKSIRILKARIKSLEKSIPKEPNKKDIREERIEYLKVQIESLQSEEKLISIVDLAENGLDWIKKAVYDKDTMHDSDLIQATEELSSIREMLLDLLKYDIDPDNTSKVKYRIQNTAIVESAKNMLSEIEDNISKIQKMSIEFLVNRMNSTLDIEVNSEQLATIKDVTWLTQQVMDTSRTEIPIAQFIDTILKKADKNKITQYTLLIDNKLKGLIDNIDLDMTKKENLDKLIQRDKNGNLTKNLLSEYSEEYWEYRSNLLSRIGYLQKLQKSDYNTNRSLKLIEEIKKLLDSHIFVNINNLNNSGEEAELVRLSNIVGEDKAKDIISVYKLNKAKYQKAYERYEDWTVRALEKGDIESESKALSILSDFEKRKNPDIILASFLEDDSKINEYTSFQYIDLVPSKNKGKYYDSDYESLKKDSPEMFELLTFIKNGLKDMINMLPPSYSRNLRENYLPEMFNESILDALKGGIKGRTLLNLLYNSVSNPSKKIDSKFNEGDMNKIKNIPIKYSDNIIGRKRNILERRKKEISNMKFDIEVLIDDNSKMKKILETITNEKARTILELRIEDNEKSINSRLANIKLEESELPKIEKDLSKLEENKSTDIIQIFKTFSLMALNYKNKAEVEDAVMLALNQLSEAETIIDTSGKKTIKDSARVIKMVEASIDSLLYGDYKDIEGIGVAKFATSEESKDELSKYRKNKRKVIKDYLEGKITKEKKDKEIDRLDNDIANVDDISNPTLSKVIDSLMSFTYKLNLGWNPMSAVGNLIYGKISNWTEAASGKYFSNTELGEAYKIMIGSIKKASTGKDNKTSNKIRSLINVYGVMFDMLEDSYGTNRGLSEKTKKLGLLNPLEGQRRGEYYNQGATMVAYLLHKKVKTKEGKEISLWEAYNDDGSIDSETLENSQEWNQIGNALTSNKFVKTRSAIQQLIVRLHGNYSPTSPILAKRTILGRMLLMYRSWMPEGFATRLETKKYDQELGDWVEGRWRTYKTLGFNGSVRTLKSLLINKAIKRNIRPDDVHITDLELENMKRNLQEVKFYLAILALGTLASMLLKGLSDDDDEEKRARTAFYLIRRLEGDISVYFSPNQIIKTMENPFPALRTVNSIRKLPSVIYNSVFSDSPSHDTDYFMRNVFEVVPFINQFTNRIYN